MVVAAMAFVTEFALLWSVKMIVSLVMTVEYIALPPDVEIRVTKEDSVNTVLPVVCVARVEPSTILAPGEVKVPCAEFLS